MLQRRFRGPLDGAASTGSLLPSTPLYPQYTRHSYDPSSSSVGDRVGDPVKSGWGNVRRGDRLVERRRFQCALQPPLPRIWEFGNLGKVPQLQHSG
jgi:hypothetical protein